MQISFGELCELNKSWSDDMDVFVTHVDRPENADWMKLGSARRVYRLDSVIWFYGDAVMLK